MACRSAYVTKRIGGFFFALSLCQLLVCEMSGLVHLSIPVPFDLAELHSEGGKFLFSLPRVQKPVQIGKVSEFYRPFEETKCLRVFTQIFMVNLQRRLLWCDNI